MDNKNQVYEITETIKYQNLIHSKIVIAHYTPKDYSEMYSDMLKYIKNAITFLLKEGHGEIVAKRKGDIVTVYDGDVHYIFEIRPAMDAEIMLDEDYWLYDEED